MELRGSVVPFDLIYNEHYFRVSIATDRCAYIPVSLHSDPFTPARLHVYSLQTAVLKRLASLRCLKGVILWLHKRIYRIVTLGEVTTAGVSPRVLCAVVAVPWSLYDLDTTRGIRGLADFCSTPIKVSNAP